MSSLQFKCLLFVLKCDHKSHFYSCRYARSCDGLQENTNQKLITAQRRPKENDGKIFVKILGGLGSILSLTPRKHIIHLLFSHFVCVIMEEENLRHCHRTLPARPRAMKTINVHFCENYLYHLIKSKHKILLGVMINNDFASADSFCARCCWLVGLKWFKIRFIVLFGRRQANRKNLQLKTMIKNIFSVLSVINFVSARMEHFKHYSEADVKRDNPRNHNSWCNEMEKALVIC